MFTLKQGLARQAAGVGLFAVAVAALLVGGGVAPGRAAASCTTTIEGRGSSLQKVAQTEVFNPSWIAAGCGANPLGAKVNYVATSSSNGLAQWGYLGSGTVNTSLSLIGTDAAPTASQIVAAKTAGHGANTVIVPVTQTAIAVIVHPPSGCTLTQITNTNLEDAFNGSATTWAALGGTGTCSGSVTRVVRAEGSGTTYQFKNYLAKIRGWDENQPPAHRADSEALPCPGMAKWSELETITTGGPPNTTWPSCGAIPVATASSGAGLAAKVAMTEGTIGYVALPDAKAQGARIVNVQDSTAGSKPLYAAPNTGEEANCGNAAYMVPAAAVPGAGTGLDVDWSQAFGGNPAIGGGTYPICTLTYDLGWRSYATAGFGSNTAGQVRAYYEFILTHKLGTTPRFYANLPTGVPGHNVQAAAEFAVSKIN